MKKIKLLLTSATLFLLPIVTFAQFTTDGSGGGFGDIVRNVLIFISGTLVPFVIGLGFLFFIWGMFLFFIAGGADDEKREKGKKLIIWATLGFVIIIVFWGLINLLSSSTGLDNQELENIPTFEI